MCSLVVMYNVCVCVLLITIYDYICETYYIHCIDYMCGSHHYMCHFCYITQHFTPTIVHDKYDMYVSTGIDT